MQEAALIPAANEHIPNQITECTVPFSFMQIEPITMASAAIANAERWYFIELS